MQQPENETQIGSYEIIDRIGQGGTSVVYRAIDTRNGESVALKVLTPLFATDPKFLRRFINEGKNVKLLDHPNIVKVFEASEADGRQFIAMELIEGGSLSALIKTREHILPIDETISIIKQIADALDYAHQMGILHRDIKLSNILITSDGRYVLSDFGSAKQMSMENTVVTQSGFSVGTPTFMSPEQAKGDPNIDRRTDVYSLGVAAYALLVGKLPFQADSQVALLHKIIYDSPPGPESINPTIPPGISYALKRALCKEPQLRYSTSGEFAAALIEGKTWIPGTMDYAAIPSPQLTRTSQIAAASRQVSEASDKRSWLGWMSLLSLFSILLLGLIGTIFFMTNEDLRNRIVAPVSGPAVSSSETPSLTPDSGTTADSALGIADEIARLEAGEFLTFTDEADRFNVDVPDGWIETVNGNTTNFDANNFMGRLFVQRVGGADSANSPQEILEAYHAKSQQDETYKNLVTVTEPRAGSVEISGRDAYEEVLAGQWLDSDVVIRLLSISDNDQGYVIGTIVDVEQSEQTQPFMDKLVGSFALSDISPARVAQITPEATVEATIEPTVEATTEPTVEATAVDETSGNESPQDEDDQSQSDQDESAQGEDALVETPTEAAEGSQMSDSESSEDDGDDAIEQSSTATNTGTPTSDDSSSGTGLTVGEILATPTIESEEGASVVARIVTVTSPAPLSAPTETATEVPPTETATEVPPTETATDVPPTKTATEVPPTETPVPPTKTATEVPPTETATEVPPTETPVPPTKTATDVPPTETATDVPPTKTATEVPPTETPIPPTKTATEVPPTETATEVPPTNTATDVPPTETPVPPTNTSTATSTSVPPTATSTRIAPTNTSTATSTSVPPTATNVPPTATNVPPTATNTLVPPTATNVPPTATNTFVPPTATNVPPTRIPPTATFTPPPPPPPPPPPTATFVPVPTRPFLFPQGAFQIIKPNVFDTDSGRTYFEWTSSVVPGPGQAYEIVFWKEGQDIIGQSFGVAQPTLKNQVTVDLELQGKALGDLLNPGEYNWTVLLVNVSPYQRVQIIGDTRTIIVTSRKN